MNIEELKLVIELVKSLSGDATSALIWWMVFDLVRLALVCGVVLAIAWMVTRGISSMSVWAQAGKQVSKAYGGDGNGCMYSADRAAIDKAIDKAREPK